MHSRFVDSLPRLEPESLLAEARFVQRLARSLVRRADLADDVAQDVFAAALQQHRGEPRHLRGWLATLTKRLAQRVRGSEQRRASYEAKAASPLADERERHTAERLRLQRQLCEAGEALPEPYRTTVTLRFFDELTPRAIAARLAVPSDVVRQRLHRGLAMLRERLDRDFGDRRSWLGAFAAAGLGAAGSPWVLLTVLAMNKLALSATAALVAGAFLLWPHDDPSPAPGGGVVVERAANRAAAANTTTANVDAVQRAAVDAPANAPVEPDCTLVVVDERGDPIVNAAVHLWSGDTLERERTTDAAGRCTFAAAATACELLVCADGWFPWRTRLAHRRGEQRLELPEGAPIDGVLVVDGTPPRRPWTLSLEPATLGDDLPTQLSERLFRREIAASRTGIGGTFAFRGVPADWKGTLELPSALWLLPESGGTVDVHRSVAVTAGTTGLRVATTQLPTLFAKLVFDDDGSPVVGVDALAIAWFVGDGTSPGFGTTSDREGNVVVGLHSARPSLYTPWCDPAARPAIERVELDLRGAGIAGHHSVRVTREQIASDEVLVVRVPRANTTHFLAVDETGAPIAGARVQANGISAPTGPDGRGTYAGTVSDVRAVGAPLHRIAAVPPRAPSTGRADDPIVFVLPRTGIVRLRVLGANGAPAPDVTVEMHSEEEPFFTGGLASWLGKPLGHPATGGHATSMRQPDGTTRHRDCVNFVELENGAADVWSMVPGRTIAFVAFDRLRRELARATCVAPPDGEELAIDIRVPGTARALRGRVVDESGAAIEKAGVRCVPVTEQRERGAHARTAADGTFTVPGVYSTEALRVTIDAPGFVVLQTEVPPVRDDDGERTFRVERGLAVTVHVVDEDGAAVDVTPRLDDAAALHDDFEDIGPVVRRWQRLPARTMTFRCRIGSTEFPVQHDTRRPDAYLRVPRLARLLITAPGGWPKDTDDTWTTVIVRRVDGPAEPETTVGSPRSDHEELLLPGRYLVELVESRRPPAGGEPATRRLFATGELTLTAGAVTRAELR